MPKGYYTDSYYVGFMPDGRKRYYATEGEYLEDYWDFYRR